MQQRPHTRLIVAGGPDEPGLRARAAALGVGEAVDFVGWLTGHELAAAYARARVLALPSVWPEAFGMAGLEALAHGIPVVAAAVGGIDAWLRAPEAGSFVPPADEAALAGALGDYLEAPERADSAGAAGRAHAAAAFGLDAHLDRLLSLLA